MAVSRQDVLRVAALARLGLSEAEVERFTEQLNTILGHVEALRELDVEGVEAVGNATEWSAPLRAESVPPDDLARAVAELAPAWEAGFFTVPRLAALDGKPSPEEHDGGTA